MTSANVIEFRIEKNGKHVGHHREHLMCKSHYEELLKFQPLNNHTITPYGYDEDEEYWESETENLNTFITKRCLINKSLREAYKNH